MQSSRVAPSSVTTTGGGAEKAGFGAPSNSTLSPTQNSGGAASSFSTTSGASGMQLPPSFHFALTEDDSDDIRQMAAALTKERPSPPQIPVYALPDEAYLEATVLPLLLRGLEELSKVRPPDPLTFLAAYLIGNNPQQSSAPLLSSADERRIPMMEVALRAAAGFDVFPPSTDSGAPLKQ